MGDAAEAFGLFVSSVEGKPVSRFGAPGVFIGATRDPNNPRKLVYDTARVVPIPLDEARLYGREYARLIAEGELVVRDAKAWAAQTVKAKADAAAVKDDHGAQSGS
jgi:predicted nucleic acid-binding protein